MKSFFVFYRIGNIIYPETTRRIPKLFRDIAFLDVA